MRIVLVSLLVALAQVNASILADGLRQDAGSRETSTTKPPDVQDVIFLGDSRPLLLRLHITIDGKPYRQVWSDQLERQFADLDKNGDTFLDSQEASRAISLVNVGFGGAGRGAALQQVVSEHDGKLKRVDFLNYCARFAGPFVGRQGQSRTRHAAALYALLDKDGDRKLSAAELEDAATALLRRDFDDNEIITEEELVAGRRTAGSALVNLGTNQPDLAGGSPVLIVTSTTKPRNIAQRLLDKYDVNQDGKVSLSQPGEIDVAVAGIGQLDRDADGFLTAGELGKFAERRPDIELRFSLGRIRSYGDLDDDNRTSKTEFRIRRRIDGSYKLDVGDAEIDFRRNNRNPSKNRQNAVPFSNFDSDNNGYIDEDEAEGNPTIAAAFKVIDGDGDGKVFRNEFDDYSDRQYRAAATRLSLEVTDQGRILFELLDDDLDGRLTPRELRTAAGLLTTRDRNGDEALDSHEIPRRVKLELARGVDLPNQIRAIVRRNRTRPSGGRRNTSGPLWFRKMDRNHDGDLSSKEFIGPREAFERLDRDGDGLIDVEEANAAKKK